MKTTTERWEDEYKKAQKTLHGEGQGKRGLRQRKSIREQGRGRERLFLEGGV